MGKSKTNIDWLRQVIERSEKEMDSNEYKEAIEFLDAVQEDMDDLEKESENKGEQIKFLQTEVDDNEREIKNMKDDEPDWEIIQAGIGTIQWQSDNIQLQGLMESIQEALKHHSPNSITQYIEGLKK